MLSFTGPISSVNVLGKTLIIINDRDLEFQILEKNSIKHSSRPHLVFAGELAGWGKLVPSQDNTPLLRAYRRAITFRVIGTRESAAKFNGLIELEARRFRLWCFILTITYGYNIEPRGEDTLVRLANLAVNKFPEAVVQGRGWLISFRCVGFFPMSLWRVKPYIVNTLFIQ
ncbi:hypothetical protein N7449_009173 [Penicillium cf. viridicatum]|uniref:Uncharacterized protein n=1 Tax=Penicillium cf. viridicatum TaxID=2972119 RepID=A0A9W9M7T5_9EURO|nr:hypothetical protein N7449_009173 [Penicillium cf. viridicatum]